MIQPSTSRTENHRICDWFLRRVLWLAIHCIGNMMKACTKCTSTVSRPEILWFCERRSEKRAPYDKRKKKDEKEDKTRWTEKPATAYHEPALP